MRLGASCPQASVSFLGTERAFRFFCNLQPVSAVRLREVFIESEAFGLRSLLPGAPPPRPQHHTGRHGPPSPGLIGSCVRPLRVTVPVLPLQVPCPSPVS